MADGQPKIRANVAGDALNIPVGLSKQEHEQLQTDILEALKLVNERQAEKLGDLYEVEKKRQAQDDLVFKLQKQGVFSSAQAKYIKYRNKMQEELNKHVVKQKWLKTIQESLWEIGEKAEGWLWKLIKMLFVFALFDPKGVFLKSILNFITQMAVWLIKVMIEWIPTLFKTMVYLFWEILLPALGNFGEQIAIALFGKNTFLQAVFSGIMQFLPIALMVIVSLTKLGKLIYYYQTAVTGYANLRIKLLKFWDSEFMLKKRIWLLEKKEAIGKWLLEKKQWAMRKAEQLRDWAWEQRLYLEQRMMQLKNWALRKKAALWEMIQTKKQWAMDKAKAVWDWMTKAKQWAVDKARAVWELAMTIKTFILEKLVALVKLLSNVTTLIMLGVILVIAIGLIIIWKKWGKQIKAFFFELWDGIKSFFKGIKDGFMDVINWLKTIVKVGFIDYARASDEEQENWKKTTRIMDLAERAKELGISKETGADQIISQTTDEEGFKKFAKQKGLEDRLAKLQKAVEKAEKAQERNSEATEKNTEEMMKEKEQAVGNKIMHAFESAGLNMNNGSLSVSNQLLATDFG